MNYQLFLLVDPICIINTGTGTLINSFITKFTIENKILLGPTTQIFKTSMYHTELFLNNLDKIFYAIFARIAALLPVTAWKPDFILATEQREPHVSH